MLRLMLLAFQVYQLTGSSLIRASCMPTYWRTGEYSRVKCSDSDQVVRIHNIVLYEVPI